MRTIESIPAMDGLDAREAAIIKQLATQYSSYQASNNLRSLYYLGKHSLRAAGKLGLAVPAQIGKLETILGWPAKAVTTLEHRLNLRGFVTENGNHDGFAEIMDDNNFLLEASMTHTASLIHGTAFVTVSQGDTQSGEPKAVIAARSAREATALWSRRSRKIIAGLTLNPKTDWEDATVSIWLPDRVITATDTRAGWKLTRQAHSMGQVPMVMLSFRPHLEEEFGVSRITKTVMGLTDSAMRTMIRMEGTAEFFSFPQRYALGVQEEDFANTFKTYLNRFLALGRDDNGELPTMGEFTSSSPQPHIEQLRVLASMFSGETSIPLNYLGIVQDNPSSADAIRAAEADLITVAERAQRTYGPAWAQVMRMAHAIHAGGWDPGLTRIEPQWRDPATPTAAATAQSVMSLVQAGVLPGKSRVTWELLGYDEATILRLEADAAREVAETAFSREEAATFAQAAQGLAITTNTWSDDGGVGKP